MRQDCREAKSWLNRCYHFSRQVEADRRMLEVMQNRLQSGVARYENDGTGSGDADAARARHEDELLEYSDQLARVEREEMELVEEITKTRKAIDKLTDSTCKAIAIDRYINRLRWDDIERLEHLSRASMFRYHLKMLVEMVWILKEVQR